MAVPGHPTGVPVYEGFAQETPYTPVKLCKSRALRIHGLQQKATVFTPAQYLNLYKMVEHNELTTSHERYR
jgi:hypothetical protein